MRPPPALWMCVVTVGVQVLLLPSGTVAFTSAVNPGFRTILTQKGLNYGIRNRSFCIVRRTSTCSLPELQEWLELWYYIIEIGHSAIYKNIHM